ncbi:MAG: hypothetical protein GSR76_00690 [Desulfurococcales archaeon]|nr:hypothetical protein [Desulfurococcales archaeon]
MRVVEMLDWVLWISVLLALLSGIGLKYVLRYKSLREVAEEDREKGLRVSSILLVASGLTVILWAIAFTVYKIIVTLGIAG